MNGTLPQVLKRFLTLYGFVFLYSEYDPANLCWTILTLDFFVKINENIVLLFAIRLAAVRTAPRRIPEDNIFHICTLTRLETNKYYRNIIAKL